MKLYITYNYSINATKKVWHECRMLDNYNKKHTNRCTKKMLHGLHIIFYIHMDKNNIVHCTLAFDDFPDVHQRLIHLQFTSVAYL